MQTISKGSGVYWDDEADKINGNFNEVVPATRRTQLGEQGVLFGSLPINFDFVNNLVVFPNAVSYIIHRNSQYSIAANTTVGIANFNSALYYNIATGTLGNAATVPNTETCILLCVIRRDKQTIFGVDNYTINGRAKEPNYGKFGVIWGKYPVNFDFVNKKLILNTAGSGYYLVFGDSSYLIAADGSVSELDITLTQSYNVGCVVYDPLTSLLACRNNQSLVLKTDILIAIFRYDVPRVWMVGNYQINGVYDNLDTEMIEMIDPLTKRGLDDYSTKVIATEKDGFRFMFFTDCHNTTTRGNFYKIRAAKHFLKYGIVDAALIGGDLISELSTRVSNIKLQTQVVNELLDGGNGKPILFARGNHDAALYGTSVDPTQIMTEKAWHQTTLRHLNGAAIFDSLNPNSSYYYVDFEQHKIRVICIDTVSTDPLVGGVVTYNPRDIWFVNQEQVNWLQAEALVVNKADKSEWGVVVFSHMSTASNAGFNIRNGAAIENLLLAFKSGTALSQAYPYATDSNFDLTVTADFVSQGAMDYICFVNGHGHWDEVVVSPVTGQPYISVIGTEEFYPPDPPAGATTPDRVVGTLTAQGFDTFTIDRANRTIYAARFGAGADRVIEY